MDISVVVEKVADDGYQATSYVPAHVVAQGRTRQEALDRLSDQLRGRLSSAELVTLSIPYGKKIETRLFTGPYSVGVNRFMRPCARSISASRPAVHDTQLGHTLYLLDAGSAQGFALGGAIELLRRELAVPSQDGVGLDNGGNLLKAPDHWS